MPEAEITLEQVKSVRDWIYDQPGSIYVSNLFPGIENGLWKVNNEPLAITNILSIRNPLVITVSDETKRLLLCSDKHAEDLSAKNIVNFENGESQTRTS